MPVLKSNLTVYSLRLFSHPLVHLQIPCFIVYRYGERQYKLSVIHACEVKLENKQSDIVEIVVLGKAAHCCQRTRVRIRKPASYSQKFLWLAVWCWINHFNAFILFLLPFFVCLFTMLPGTFSVLCLYSALYSTVLACSRNSWLSLEMININCNEDDLLLCKYTVPSKRHPTRLKHCLNLMTILTTRYPIPQNNILRAMYPIRETFTQNSVLATVFVSVL